jgi:spore coat protein U-like protein
MAFNTLVAAVNQTTSTISVTCTTGDVYSVALSAGDSAVENARFMKGNTTSADHLSYALTSGNYAGPNWGTASGFQPGTGNGGAQPFIVYGQITAAQALLAPVDTYSDTITVNVTY